MIEIALPTWIHRRPFRALWFWIIIDLHVRLNVRAWWCFFPKIVGWILSGARSRALPLPSSGWSGERVVICGMCCPVRTIGFGILVWFGLIVPGGLVYCRCLGAVFRAWQANLNLWWSYAGTSPWFVLA